MVKVLESSSQDASVPENGCNLNKNTTECTTRQERDIHLTSMETNLTPIQKFYYGQSVFLTGGTGFLGKLLIEKLLRECPGISFIYMLVRPKKGKDVQQRVEELFDDPVFCKLKEMQPKFRHQTVAVAGDCNLPGLGISPMDRAIITKEVSIVMHIAATVKFDEKINLAVPINVQGPKAVIDLCKEMPGLKSFVHVSTAYSNCPLPVIEERVYDPPMDGDKLLTLIECVDEKLLDDITPRLLGIWPNTYSFTKAVAESVVKKEAGNLPVGIFRPAIVTSTYLEPVRGWIDNLYGPTGIVAGGGTGILRSVHVDQSKQLDMVPGDFTVNALIACAWDVANRYKSTCTKEEKKNDIPVYNYVSQDNPITYNLLHTMCRKYWFEFPTEKAMWYICFHATKHRILYLFYIYFMHLLPALLIDTAMLCVGKQPRMLKLYKKIHKFTGVLNYFSMRDWTFTNSTFKSVLGKLSPEDRANFVCDITKVDWNQFFRTYIQGVRVYLLKDPLETLPAARVKWRRLYWLHATLKFILTFAMLTISWLALSHLCGKVTSKLCTHYLLTDILQETIRYTGLDTTNDYDLSINSTT